MLILGPLDPQGIHILPVKHRHDSASVQESPQEVLPPRSFPMGGGDSPTDR